MRDNPTPEDTDAESQCIGAPSQFVPEEQLEKLENVAGSQRSQRDIAIEHTRTVLLRLLQTVYHALSALQLLPPDEPVPAAAGGAQPPPAAAAAPLGPRELRQLARVLLATLPAIAINRIGNTATPSAMCDLDPAGYGLLVCTCVSCREAATWQSALWRHIAFLARLLLLLLSGQSTWCLVSQPTSPAVLSSNQHERRCRYEAVAHVLHCLPTSAFAEFCQAHANALFEALVEDPSLKDTLAQVLHSHAECLIVTTASPCAQLPVL